MQHVPYLQQLSAEEERTRRRARLHKLQAANAEAQLEVPALARFRATSMLWPALCDLGKAMALMCGGRWRGSVRGCKTRGTRLTSCPSCFKEQTRPRCRSLVQTQVVPPTRLAKLLSFLEWHDGGDAYCSTWRGWGWHGISFEAANPHPGPGVICGSSNEIIGHTGLVLEIRLSASATNTAAARGGEW